MYYVCLYPILHPPSYSCMYHRGALNFRIQFDYVYGNYRLLNLKTLCLMMKWSVNLSIVLQCVWLDTLTAIAKNADSKSVASQFITVMLFSMYLLWIKWAHYSAEDCC